MSKTVTVAGKTIWHLATEELGDVTQAVRIAVQNGIKDPWDESMRAVAIPDQDPSYSGGGLPPE